MASPAWSPAPALELPLDATRAARAGRVAPAIAAATPREVAPIHGATAPNEATLLAMFAAQLARYNGQPAIPITATRLGGGGEVAWTAPVVLAIEGHTFGELVTAAAGELARPAAPVETCGGDHAAITFAPAGAGDAAALAARGPGAAADLHLVARGDALAFVHDRDALAPATVARMAGHLAALLDGRRDDLRVAELPLLQPAERAWLDAVARGPSRPPAAVPAHHLVEAFARSTPDAIAVRHRGESIDYAELDRRADALARVLVARGASRRHVVVCLEPSLDTAVAMLAIWKAAAVYVPLDPSYPPARVAVILDDVAPALVLTRAAFADRLDLHARATLDPAAAGVATSELPAVSAADPAYIFYTSGTTGRPKGVVASHANLAHYLAAARDRYAIAGSDVIPAIARTSFSISLFELMSPLTAGGTLVVLDRDVVLDPARLLAALEAGVTLFHAGPSLLKALLGHIERSHHDVARLDGVRHASSGGDLVPVSVLRGLVAAFRRAEVFVIYGCSEIACMGCTYPVPRDRPIQRTFVGTAMDNVVARVLDRDGNPVPVGVVGEVWFGGAGVALGYLDRPELTAARFVDRDGDRGYATGDLGRIAADGNLELVGRSDFQIKVRGMRIELAEVEHHLRAAPGVVDGVVAARDTPAGDRALIGYVVLVPEARGDRAALAAVRRHLAAQLPDYMVPAVYLELAALPLNHNLKLDRNALPAPPAVGTADATRPADTDTEHELAAAFRRLLGVDRVGVDDNFFELGGDSITALELIATIERELGVRLDGLEVLREPLCALAATCDRRRGRPARATRPIRDAGDARDRWDAFHFGDGDALYGVLRGGTAEHGGTAVLIAAPPDQDRARAGFVLGRLAHRLADRGVPSLGFDLYGTWDSLGDSRDATVARWRADLHAAHGELVRRTGAARVVAVAVRLAAPLVAGAGLRLARLVLWDPVDDGAAWYAQAVAQHRACVRGLADVRRGRPARRAPDVEELCGTVYARATLHELAALRLAAPPGVEVVAHATSLAWHDAARIEELFPDAGISRALADAALGVP